MKKLWEAPNSPLNIWIVGPKICLTVDTKSICSSTILRFPRVSDRIVYKRKEFSSLSVRSGFCGRRFFPRDFSSSENIFPSRNFVFERNEIDRPSGSTLQFDFGFDKSFKNKFLFSRSKIRQNFSFQFSHSTSFISQLDQNDSMLVRLSVSDENHNDARIAWIQHNNWSNVAILHQDSTDFSLVRREIKFFEQQHQFFRFLDERSIG